MNLSAYAFFWSFAYFSCNFQFQLNLIQSPLTLDNDRITQISEPIVDIIEQNENRQLFLQGSLSTRSKL